MSTGRIACLFVPQFPLTAIYRAQPELRGQPIALCTGPGPCTPNAPLAAVAPALSHRGVRPGMTLAQARAIVPGLLTRPRSVEAERGAQAALTDVAHGCSPRVEDAGSGTVFLDLQGMGSIFSCEEHLATVLAARAHGVGIEVRVGIAGSKTTAHVAARASRGKVTVIPAGEEAAFLAPLPISTLTPDPDTATTLSQWGIRYLGELARLPLDQVATRLGPAGLALARQARGEHEELLHVNPAPLHFQEAIVLDCAAYSLDSLLFVFRALLDRLTARLATRGLACGGLDIHLGREDGGAEMRHLDLAAPTTEIKTLLALLRLHLADEPPGASVKEVRISAQPRQPRSTQLDFFRPAGPAPERLATTLARLAAHCGADRVGMPVVLDSYRPEAVTTAPFVLPGTPPPPSLPPNPRLALRAFRPPRPAEVFCDRGEPDVVRAKGLGGRVVTAAGPWRVTGEWWAEEKLTRDYYDVELSDGGLYRIYRDLQSQSWFVDGMYD